MNIVIPAHTTRNLELIDSATKIEIIVHEGAQLMCRNRSSQNEGSFHLSIVAHAHATVVYKDERTYPTDAPVEETITLQADADSSIEYGLDVQHPQSLTTTLSAKLAGERAEIVIRCGVLLHRGQTHTLRTLQHHTMRDGKSTCKMRAIVADSAQSYYEGMIQIDQSAPQTQAHQEHKAVLLDSSAYAYARPSLQVETDDVQCGHGSAIGQLSHEHMEFLQARGISFDQSKKMLLDAFMDDVWDQKR